MHVTNSKNYEENKGPKLNFNENYGDRIWKYEKYRDRNEITLPLRGSNMDSMNIKGPKCTFTIKLRD